MEGEGFKKLAGKFIEIGARYGKVEAANLIPVSTTVSRHLGGLYEKEKQIWKSN